MKRLWGIRHVRHVINVYRLNKWVEDCRKLGIGIVASPRDEEYLDDILAGRA